MVALIGNLAPWELLVIAGVAVIVFGRRLPEVASKAYAQLRRARQSLERVRRETGIDKELRSIERSVREASREAGAAMEHTPHPTAEEARAATPEGDEGQAQKGAEDQAGSGEPAS